MPSPKMPAAQHISLSDLDLTRKVLSFGYFSLHQQGKVTRREAKALASGAGSHSSARQGQERFALTGEVLSFAGPKESTQRKRPPREIKIAQGGRGAVATFGLAIPGSIRKRRPSMAAALRVSGSDCAQDS